MNLEDYVKTQVKNLIKDVTIKLPQDLLDTLKFYLNNITRSEGAKFMLKSILMNCELATIEEAPICQDTGIPTFIVKVGDDFPLKSRIGNILKYAVMEATREIPLRPNTTCPITNKLSSDNVGKYVPWIDYELVEGDYVDIFYVPKGGGSEYPCKALTITPRNPWNILKKLFLKILTKYHAMPCPPLIVGIGIGGTIDMAIKIAKKALYLRRIGERHGEEFIARIEEELINLGNRLEVGPHGVGDYPTVIDVHVDYAYRHPATFSIAFIISCWAYRRGGIRIYSSGKIEKIL